jgi:hypothetical protein
MDVIDFERSLTWNRIQLSGKLRKWILIWNSEQLVEWCMAWEDFASLWSIFLVIFIFHDRHWIALESRLIAKMARSKMARSLFSILFWAFFANSSLCIIWRRSSDLDRQDEGDLTDSRKWSVFFSVSRCLHGQPIVKAPVWMMGLSGHFPWVHLERFLLPWVSSVNFERLKPESLLTTSFPWGKTASLHSLDSTLWHPR